MEHYKPFQDVPEEQAALPICTCTCKASHVWHGWGCRILKVVCVSCWCGNQGDTDTRSLHTSSLHKIQRTHVHSIMSTRGSVLTQQQVKRADARCDYPDIFITFAEEHTCTHSNTHYVDCQWKMTYVLVSWYSTIRLLPHQIYFTVCPLISPPVKGGKVYGCSTLLKD